MNAFSDNHTVTERRGTGDERGVKVRWEKWGKVRRRAEGLDNEN